MLEVLGADALLPVSASPALEVEGTPSLRVADK
jgi:hypothetical protein